MHGLEFRAPSPGSHASNNQSLSVLFKMKGMLRKTLAMQYLWFAASFGFYGLSQNAGSYSGNKYFNFLASGLLEIPGVTISWLIVSPHCR